MCKDAHHKVQLVEQARLHHQSSSLLLTGTKLEILIAQHVSASLVACNDEKLQQRQATRKGKQTGIATAAPTEPGKQPTAQQQQMS